MKECENCSSEHDGFYGSGRFCSIKCSRGFSTKAKRKEINEKVSKKLKDNIPWHKGKIGVYSKEHLEKQSIKTREYFQNNPGEASRRNTGRIHSKETKIKISNSLIKDPHICKCKTCQKEFLSKNKHKNFCSKECRYNNLEYRKKLSVANKGNTGGKTKGVEEENLGGTKDIGVIVLGSWLM